MDKLCLEGIYRQGYGIIPKFVMHDQDLTLESKAIYAYLCSLAGSGDQTFPYRDTILRQLGLSKNTYYRHYRLLLEQGYLTVERPADKTAANIYTLVQNPKKLPFIPTKGEGSHLRYRGLRAHGYGSLPRTVMMDEDLSVKAKGLYAYFCSYCGSGDCAFPRRDDILFHLNISEPTYYKMLDQLKGAGYLEVVQRKDNSRFAVNDYFLNDHPAGPGPQPSRGQVISFPGTENCPNTTEQPSSGSKAKPGQSVPNKAKTATAPTMGDRESITSPCQKIWDIRNGDTEIWDIKNCDANINNNSSSNNLFSNNPSNAGEDGQIVMQELALRQMEDLLRKQPRKNQETAIAAREFLARVWKEQGGDHGLVQLLEAFVPHLEKGLQGKQVRNLRAYCKASLNNWLAEQPLREEMGGRNCSSRSAASYDLEELEAMVNSGDFLNGICGG